MYSEHLLFVCSLKTKKNVSWSAAIINFSFNKEVLFSKFFLCIFCFCYKNIVLFNCKKNVSLIQFFIFKLKYCEKIKFNYWKLFIFFCFLGSQFIGMVSGKEKRKKNKCQFSRKKINFESFYVLLNTTTNRLI